jgi:hypothetical protein
VSHPDCRVGEHRQKAAVALDGDDGTRRLAERDGERADAGPDLEYRLVTVKIREREDPADHVVVNEEVLAERLAGLDVVGAQNRDRGAWCGKPRVGHRLLLAYGRMVMVTVRRPQFRASARVLKQRSILFPVMAPPVSAATALP